MSMSVGFLILQALCVYLLVLWVHSLRSRCGLGPFYALLGGLTAIMSWVTDAGVRVEAGGITFVVGSTVFYTALLLGVFVLYAFDGPRSTRVAILTVAGVSALVPIVAAVLQFQMGLKGQAQSELVPVPSARINTASVAATIADLVFLAMAWEFLGKAGRRIKLWPRVYLTLLGVMWLDVALFATGAFAGTPGYLNIMGGTLISRLIIATLASPVLFAYMAWQNRLPGITMEKRPVLAIFQEVAEVRAELRSARKEIERRIEVEEQLRHAKETLEATFASITEAVIIVDSVQRRIVDCNQAVERILGYTREELIGRPTLVVHVDEESHEEFRRASEEILERGEPFHSEFQLRKKDGTIIQTEHTVTTLSESAGWRGGVVSVIRDITRQRSLESQLRHAQKMDAVGRLAGGIAHDFNNILQAITGYAQLLLDEARDRGESAVEAEEILKSSERAATLTRQLLSFSRRQVMRPELIDINGLVDNLQRMLGRLIGADIRFLWEPGEVLPVRADIGMIEQVLLNLCLNARDAMPEGGTLTIGTELIHLDEAFCQPRPWARPGRFVVIRVTDTGEGMDGETLEHIFEPFFTTKGHHGGPGLGLATVYGIVQQHTGLIVAESEPGIGTTLKVFLPAGDCERESHEMDSDSPAVAGSETILLAEDEPAVRQLGQRILERAGYRVLLAGDGTEAMEVFRENAEDVDLLLLDVVMPNLGGREVLEQIRAVNPRTPVIFSTGYGASGSHTDFVLDQGCALISKPYGPSQLLRCVRKALDESSSLG